MCSSRAGPCSPPSTRRSPHGCGRGDAGSWRVCRLPRLHGSRWIDAKLPAELNQPSRHKARGIILHSDHLAEDEVGVLDGIRVTTPARTAFDLGRRRGLATAVIRVDALLRRAS